MSFALPQGNNTYVPSFEASGRLITEFSRKPDSFLVNKYVGIKKVDLRTGYYLSLDPDESVRVTSDDEYIWNDGSDAPRNYIEQGHEFKQYATHRRAFPFMLGDQTVQQAQWDVIASHAATAASVAMTQRTKITLAALQNAGNWGTHTATATSLGGGKFDAGTSALPYLRKALFAAAEAINLATNGVVTQNDLIVVMNPETGRKIAASQELTDYIKQSYFGRAQILGDDAFLPFGPSSLFGFNAAYENAVLVSSKRKATGSRSYVLGDGIVLVLARPDALVSTQGPTFNTCTLFMHEEMTAETKYDADNRRTLGRVVEDYGVVMTAPSSGFLITAAVD